MAMIKFNKIEKVNCDFLSHYCKLTCIFCNHNSGI